MLFLDDDNDEGEEATSDRLPMLSELDSELCENEQAFKASSKHSGAMDGKNALELGMVASRESGPVKFMIKIFANVRQTLFIRRARNGP